MWAQHWPAPLHGCSGGVDRHPAQHAVHPDRGRGAANLADQGGPDQATPKPIDVHKLSPSLRCSCGALNTPPHGCVQYFTGVSGTLTSFNFGNTDDYHHLAEQYYSICIRLNLHNRGSSDFLKEVNVRPTDNQWNEMTDTFAPGENRVTVKSDTTPATTVTPSTCPESQQPQAGSSRDYSNIFIA